MHIADVWGQSFMKHAGSFASAEMLSVYQFMHTLNDAQKPVIAAVSGGTVGIGTTFFDTFANWYTPQKIRDFLCRLPH